MESALRKDALTETFNDVENLTYEIIWRFTEKYKKDFNGNFEELFEELKAEANLQFILAFDSYQETKAYFTTWLYFFVWKRLLDYRNKDKKHTKTSLEDIDTNQLLTKKKNHSHTIGLFEEVSLDSKIIIQLVFSPPEGLPDEDLVKGFSKRRTRAHIKNYLFTKLNWKTKRIKEAFEEIRNALQE